MNWSWKVGNETVKDAEGEDITTSYLYIDESYLGKVITAIAEKTSAEDVAYIPASAKTDKVVESDRTIASVEIVIGTEKAVTVNVGDTLGIKVADNEDNAVTSGVTYQWMANGTNIENATKATYKVVAADAGKTISVAVKPDGTNYVGETPTKSTGVEVAKSGSTVSGEVKIAGTLVAGETLTAEVTATITGLEYQWYKDGVAIADAKEQTYQVPSELGTTAKYKVVVTGSNNFKETSEEVTVITTEANNARTAIDDALANPDEQTLTFVVTDNTTDPVTKATDKYAFGDTTLTQALASNWTNAAYEKMPTLTVTPAKSAELKQITTTTANDTLIIDCTGNALADGDVISFEVGDNEYTATVTAVTEGTGITVEIAKVAK